MPLNKETKTEPNWTNVSISFWWKISIDLLGAEAKYRIIKKKFFSLIIHIFETQWI